MYLLDRGLNLGSDFKKAIRIEKPQSMNALLLKAQAYIAYMEKEVAIKREPRAQDTLRASKYDDPLPYRRGWEKTSDYRSCETREHMRPSDRYTEYTTLIALCECILAEC